MDMIFTIGIFTSLFFFVLLLNKKNKSLPDLILSSWMLVIGIHLASTYVNVEGYWDVYPHLIGITVPFPLFYGPFLFLYISYSIKDERRLRIRDYLHFLPILASYIYMLPFYFFYSADEKRMVDKGLIDDYGTFSAILVVSFVLSAIAYAILSFRLLKRHKNLLDDNFSNTEHINLRWLKGFIWGIALIFLTVAVVLLSRDVMEVSFPFNADFIFYTMIVFAILSLGYFGIRHENIFTDNLVVEFEEKSASYQSSSLKDEIARSKHTELTALMVDQKPYLEPNLTLTALAKMLGIPPHHLSQIINQFETQNFNDYINKHRVDEFIDRALRDSHFSFLALAMDSGFNSKSTFNAVFRKHKGVTPSQYMARYEKENS